MDTNRVSQGAVSATAVGAAMAVGLAIIALLAAPLALAPGGGAWARSAAAPLTDFAERPSHHGLYRAEVVHVGGPVRAGRAADWRVRVRAADGSLVPGLIVAAVLGASEAGGDLVPVRVDAAGAEGEFRFRGVRLEGAGWWALRVQIRSALGTDSLAFNVVIRDASEAASATGAAWSAGEVETLRSLWIGSLPMLPADPSNRFADDPAAAAFGHRLFFETRLSSSGTVSCASCHRPDREFQDDIPLGVGVGRTDRRTMPVAGTAYSPFLFWDGRKDSQWAQALGPLESPVEHGSSRARYAHVVVEHHRAEYEAVFGPMPDLAGIPRDAGPVDDPAARAAWDALTPAQRDAVTSVFVNLGKAMAAYQRRLIPGPSRFDRYVERLLADGGAPAGVLDDAEVAGLRLFIGRANCLDCHNGPLFTNQEFHNTGVPAVRGLPEDRGRAAGAPGVLADEFNCRSRWSDADPASCAELEFMVTEGHELVRAFKVPSLRNVADRPPYMHAGQIASLAGTIAHYDRAPRSPAGHSELRRLRLSRRERAQLEAYLRTLSGGIDAPAELLMDPTREPHFHVVR